MRFWDWYQRVVLSIIALSLILITLRFYATPNFFRAVYRHSLRAQVPVYVVGGSVDVEVTNTPSVEVSNTL